MAPREKAKKLLTEPAASGYLQMFRSNWTILPDNSTPPGVKHVVKCLGEDGRLEGLGMLHEGKIVPAIKREIRGLLEGVLDGAKTTPLNGIYDEDAGNDNLFMTMDVTLGPRDAEEHGRESFRTHWISMYLPERNVDLLNTLLKRWGASPVERDRTPRQTQ